MVTEVEYHECAEPVAGGDCARPIEHGGRHRRTIGKVDRATAVREYNADKARATALDELIDGRVAELEASL